MRRFIVLLATLACFGGCSCQDKPRALPPKAVATAPAQALSAPALPSAPPIAPEAMEWHMQGRERGKEGQFQEALQLFQQAQAAAPDWLFPLYDTGYTYILMGDTAKALETFEQVDARAPQGFSESKKFLDSLRREKAGTVPPGTLRDFLALRQLRDPKQTHQKLVALTQRAPQFVPAWQELAMSEEDPVAAGTLVEKTLALNPDIETRGMLLVHQATLLRRRGQQDEALKKLRALAGDAQLPPRITSLARELQQTLPPPAPSAPAP
ncbi:tetratricopeptide repeat protein [Stigmatella aurantiaca]|uniref:Tetratricopeptide repeat domain protein n=1 Tax=Stigmatella aurantiaca (strain DW4/3-1) TaxID=378806 RepID=Q08ZR1_STIAD|nr:tetratricopeptide repeat protein [Stigmatella aurantiaca]ADO74825.1 Tetratricopeptide repeat domain protein [Stigmatella aurantiaca DW4/3-1]EAU65989.1 tetratricopeptide repeat domain protein [Stigmatella aurantiaca DW4/3-1]